MDQNSPIKKPKKMKNLTGIMMLITLLSFGISIALQNVITIMVFGFLTLFLQNVFNNENNELEK